MKEENAISAETEKISRLDFLKKTSLGAPWLAFACQVYCNYN